MGMIDDIKDKAEDLMPLVGVGAIWRGIKKAPSAAWWLLTKSPTLVRRGAQLAAIYAFTYIVEKLLDFLHEQFPDSELLAKADTTAHKVVNAENSLIGGAASLAKSAYDTVTGKKTEPGTEQPKVEGGKPILPALPELETGNAKIETESMKTAQAALPPVADEELRQAAFMPVEPRNRANLNTALAIPAKPVAAEPAPEKPALAAPVSEAAGGAPVMGPDGKPINGGFDPATGITWGPYMKPYTGPRPVNKLTFKP